MRPASRWVVVVVVSVLLILLGGSLSPGPSPGRGSMIATSETSSPVLATDLATVSPALGSPSMIEVAPAFVPGAGVVALGPQPSSAPMTALVELAMPDPSALEGFISALYVPGTALYHHFETPSELARQFGPSAQSVNIARQYFERFGLAVNESPDHLLLTVTGSSADLGAAFGTSFEEYRDADGRLFVSHSTAATLPSIVPWSGVLGLGNSTPILPAVSTSDLTGAQVPQGVDCLGDPSDLGPCQVWEAYNMSPLIDSGTNGSGFRIAVVDAYSSAEGQPALTSDLAKFVSANSLSVGRVNYVYPVPGTGNVNVSANTGWNYEDALDLEWARAAAPGATIDMTFSPNSGTGLYEAIDWLVAHQATDVISLSWGEPDVGIWNSWDSGCYYACNASTDGSYGILSPVLEYAAAEGISVFAASGDCGANDGTPLLSTNFPASDPTVTGVGGTWLILNENSSYNHEIGWNGTQTGTNQPGCQNQGGSGGGYSPFPRPAWQTGLPAGTPGRGVPDVSLDAQTPVNIYQDGQIVGILGTSVGTPIWAGIAAIADQAAGHSLGFLNPSLYAIASDPSSYARDFHDILVGNNSYSAGPGWDPVTGLGTPLVAPLVSDLSHAGSLAINNLSAFVYATPRFGPAPLTVTFHAGVSGGSGSYPIEGVSFGDGNASRLVAGAATHTFAFPGVYLAQAYAVDSSANDSVSPPVAIVVGGGGALSVNLTASMQTPAVGGVVDLLATVHGGRAPYTYNFTFGDGTYSLPTTASLTSHVFNVRGSFCAEVVVSDSASPVDGGASGRVSVGVGGARLPDCENDTVPLVIHAGPTPGVRDAPADFPDLSSIFSVSGGSTEEGGLAPSLAVTVDDPYATACGCSIFRAPGTYSVTAFANDSVDQQATSVANVTVAPPLVGTFTANRTFGTAPLRVSFQASSSGGFDASASNTVWTFGDGMGTVGAAVSTTYAAPGLYVAMAHLSDLGHGNASEAILIDVGSAAGSLPFLTATISPAFDVPLGSTVNLTSGLRLANGSGTPAEPHWSVAADSGAYRPAFNWTYSSADLLAANGSLLVSLHDMATVGGGSVNATFWLSSFGAAEPGGFQPRVDALALIDHAGPELGVEPLTWSGTASVSGPGTVSLQWTLGASVLGSSGTVTESFLAGEYTVVAAASDSWGDEALDDFPVRAVPALGLSAVFSATSGYAPLTVSYYANVSGGFGPPYLYDWAFGDNTTASTANGTHTFADPGMYVVSILVSDSEGDTATMHWNVSVLAAPASSGGGFPWLWVVIGVGAGGAVAAAVVAVVLIRRRSREGPVSP